MFKIGYVPQREKHKTQ
ncbi:hypothetical protein CFP56_042698 [Quercus suber]|uniref:Uncharacterized protein n=1 Tax=Quercus suber TaxID=58331 RepID=A0AAW0LJL5_QUESU